MTETATGFPFDISEDAFHATVAVLVEAWRANPAADPTMTAFNVAWLRAFQEQSPVWRDRQPTGEDLQRFFGLDDRAAAALATALAAV